MCWLIVLSESGTESILEAAVSPSITEDRSFAAGRINVSPVVCAFPALAIRNATRYEATVAFPFNLTKSSKKKFWPWKVWSFLWKKCWRFSCYLDMLGFKVSSKFCGSHAVISQNILIILERPPSILVPLKVHSPPQGFQLYMTCAVRGLPTPHVAWYLNNICINSNNSYYITNAYGVCSMYIIRVGPEHSGEYKVGTVNSFGKAECSTKLKVRGI